MTRYDYHQGGSGGRANPKQFRKSPNFAPRLSRSALHRELNRPPTNPLGNPDLEPGGPEQDPPQLPPRAEVESSLGDVLGGGGDALLRDTEGGGERLSEAYMRAFLSQEQAQAQSQARSQDQDQDQDPPWSALPLSNEFGVNTNSFGSNPNSFSSINRNKSSFSAMERPQAYATSMPVDHTNFGLRSQSAGTARPRSHPYI